MTASFSVKDTFIFLIRYILFGTTYLQSNIERGHFVAAVIGAAFGVDGWVLYDALSADRACVLKEKNHAKILNRTIYKPEHVVYLHLPQ